MINGNLNNNYYGEGVDMKYTSEVTVAAFSDGEKQR